MVKEITISPAWDKTHPEPSKNYGIHCCDLRFIYGDPNVGMISFLVYSGWYLPQNKRDFVEPTGADISYHSVKPQYEGQQPNTCDLLTCKQCYCDGSGLQAIELFNKLVAEGSDAVWKELESLWNKLFNP